MDTDKSCRPATMWASPSPDRLDRAKRRIVGWSPDCHAVAHRQVNEKLATLANQQEADRYRNLYALCYILGDVVRTKRVAAE